MIESGYFFNAIKRDISMVRGDTLSFAFQLKGLGGQRPSGVLFTVKESLEDTTPLIQVSLENTIDERDYDAENDILTYSVRIPPEKTAEVALGRYFYDLEVKVNGDTITLMIGRLSVEYEVTTGTSPTPHYDSGDDILYPVADIPVGSVKLYTEQRISDIAQAINDVTGDINSYTTQDMSGAIAGLGDTIEALEERISELEGEIPPEIDNIPYPGSN